MMFSKNDLISFHESAWKYEKCDCVVSLSKCVCLMVTCVCVCVVVYVMQSVLRN